MRKLLQKLKIAFSSVGKRHQRIKKVTQNKSFQSGGVFLFCLFCFIVV